MVDSKSLPHVDRGRSRPSMSNPVNSLPLKPSAPIQIPAGRRPKVFANASPNFVHAMSPPDSVFEMSPVTSEFAGYHHPSFSLSQNDRNSDSFLYNFPSFSSRHPQAISDQFHPNASDRTALSMRHRVADPLAIRKSPPPPKANCVLDEYDLSPGLPYTKAEGFTPMKENRCDGYHRSQSRRMERLSPGPRQPSYSSPWILPGRGDAAEEDVAYSQVDPSAFEFQRHLLQRIETQNPSNILNMRSYM